MNPPAPLSIDTAAVHTGEPTPRIEGAVAIPVFQTSTYLYEGTTGYDACRYVRLSNSPNHRALHEKIAALEGAEAALVTASGMAAISTALLTVLKHGDHLLAVDCPYGGTRTLIAESLGHFGIEHTFITHDDPAEWERQVRPNTRVIYMESITNPLMQVPDLQGAVDLARRHDLVAMIDNTFTSPVNFRPLEMGFDLSLHSATKYLNGHSDIAAGAVAGGAALVARVHHLLNHLGGSLDPHACALLHRGMKTLGLRMARHNDNAIRIAAFLADHPRIERVNFPGLPDHPEHARARELFDGVGGMLSFEITGDVADAEAFLGRLKIPLVAVSLGGVETLVIRPAVTAYADVSPQERSRLGVSDRLIRMSVGIEDAGDLISDLAAALA